MSSVKKILEVSLASAGRSVRVSWYEGASDDSIRKALCAALGLDEGTPIILRDSDGDVVAISSSLPSGLKVVAEATGPAVGAPPMLTPRGPKPYPFVGNLLELFSKGGPFVPLSRLTQEYGDFVRLKVPRGQVFINSDPDVLSDMLQRPEDFPKIVTTSPSPLRKLREGSAAGNGLFTTDDTEEIWHVAHRVLLPALGLGALKQYYPRMLEVADELIDKLATLRPDEPFVVTDMMTRMTFEAISYTGFNTKWGCINSDAQPPFVQAMTDVLVIGMESAGNILPDVFHPFVKQKRAQANRVLLETVDRIIEERRAALERGDKVPNDILQAMLTTRDKVTGKRLPDDNIRAQLITFLIAGHETTSGLLSYALHAIAKNPEVERRLQQEADAVLGRDYSYAPTFQDIEKLDYTQRVLKEALRLSPTAPAFGRKVARDTVVAGKYAVPFDSTIITFLPSLHRNARFWPDAERFDPERFTKEAVASRHPDAYHPFGMGMRSCIGFQFALIEAKLVLARLMQRFTPRLHDPNYKLENVQTLTIKPKDLSMVLSPRAEERGRGPTVSVSSTAASAQQQVAASSAESGAQVLILYGSNMGASQDVAQTLARKARAHGFAPTVQELDTRVGKLPAGAPVIIVTSTYNGNPPDNATHFFDWLRRADLPADTCQGVCFAVLGCGNKQWKTTFQKFPRFVDTRLRELGAESFFPIGACDADGDFEAAAEAFCDGVWPALRARFGSAAAADVAPCADDAPLYTVEVVNFAGTESAAALPSRYPLHDQALWTTVLKNDELQSADSGRSTRHLELALPDGVRYAAGDHLGVFPENPAALVNAIAERCGARLSDVVILRPNSAAGATAEALPCGIPITVFDLLTYHIDLAGPLSRKELRALGRACPCPPERAPIEALCQDGAFRSEVIEGKLGLHDVLLRWKSVECSLAMLLSLRPLLKPRYYSISSSPRVLVGAMSITVGVHSCPRQDGSTFDGLCSHYLEAKPKGAQLRVVVKDTRSTFRLPDDPARDVILIGPGTGLSPLRGFIEERAALRRSGASVGQTVLFFGCRHPAHDYLYQQELEAYVKDGTLNALHVAFSREPGKPKRYVQHHIREQAEALRQLVERGAYVYICGDAKNMAPDVQNAFTEILQAPTMDKLRAEGRYLQDVWAST
jgi:cytochrome P450/NADPH-cytochrome P450 reductase